MATILGSVSQSLQQQGVRLDHVLTQDAPGQDVTLSKPLNPPGNWTKFKAALSGLPLLGKIGSLQEARASIASYPVRLGQYQASNRQILTGLRADLCAQYGDDIATTSMAGLLPADGAPLTGRAVSTILQKAERSQAQARSFNNIALMRFLENGLTGGARMPGDTDMIGVCLKRGIQFGGQGTWQGAVGPGAARFIEHQITQSCKALPAYSQGYLSNADIAQAAGRALDLYQELLAAPGMTPEKLDPLLASAVRSDGKAGAQAVAMRAREFVITEHMTGQMDHARPESMFSRAARDATESRGLPPLPASTLKAISRNMVEGLSYRAAEGKLARDLGCTPDVGSVIPAFDPRLQAQVRRVLDEHLDALQMIDQSTTLSPAARDTLRQIAATRRIDPEQVRVYEAVSRDLASVIEALERGLPQGSPAQALALLGQMQARLDAGVTAMNQHAYARWEWISLNAGDVPAQLRDQISTLMARACTPEQAQRLLDALTSAEGARLCGSLGQYGDPNLARQTGMLYNAVAALAVRAGRTPEQALQLARGLEDRPAPAQSGVPAPLLHHIFAADPDAIDPRGVVPGARNGALVSPGFNARQLTGEQRAGILHWALRDPAVGDRPWLSDAMEKDVGRATYILNGQRIDYAGGDKATALTSFRAAFAPGPAGDAMALAVGRCANQIGIGGFSDDKNLAAFPGQFFSTQDTKTTHEISANPDGSWTVRTTYAGRPNALISRETGEQTEVPDRGGLALYSLTYRIQPPEGDGQPRVSIEDSRVVFNF